MELVRLSFVVLVLGGLNGSVLGVMREGSSILKGDDSNLVVD